VNDNGGKKSDDEGKKEQNKEWAEKKALVAKPGFEMHRGCKCPKRKRLTFFFHSPLSQFHHHHQCIQRKNHYSNGAKGSRN
jgi:hypothetical protein